MISITGHSCTCTMCDVFCNCHSLIGCTVTHGCQINFFIFMIYLNINALLHALKPILT